MHQFSDQEPVWVKYAIYVSPPGARTKSNKFYECRIDLDDAGWFVLTKRWGARPDKGDGQVKQHQFGMLSGAETEANRIFTEKIAKGYEVVERPVLASRHVTYDDEFSCISCGADVTDVANACAQNETYTFTCPQCGVTDHI